MEEFEYSNGDHYVGEWKLINNLKMRCGFGKFTRLIQNDSGNQYEEYAGQWQNDRMHGYGTFKYLSGAVYEGEWSEGLQNGQGSYTFANGTKYIGEWKNHSMHGLGVYIDEKGGEWEGVFIDGSYESKIQKELKAQYDREQLILRLKSEGLAKLQEFMSTFEGDKKAWKENFNKYLVTNPEEVEELVSEPYSRWEERNGDKWGDLLRKLVDCDPHVLTSQGDSILFSDARVYADQLQGKGQVIEFVKSIDNRKIELAIVMNENSDWLIFHSVDISLK